MLKKIRNLAERYHKLAAFAKIDRAKIAPKAIEACKILQDHGFESYLVGGCVRDLLLGKVPKDWDITTNAKPEQVQKIFPKTYPTGIQHGTITVSMGTTPADHFEITTYRGEGEYVDGRRPNEVYFVDGVTEDLARRDLTINAIAYDPVNDKIEDPYGGIKDLEDKMIRAVGNPDERFREDGLRTMRVARFAARLGFNIDPATEAAIANNLETLAKVSRERMRDELTKTLLTPHPSVGLSILHRTGALGVLGPSFHNTSIPSTFDQIDKCQGSMETKMAILLHHLGRAELDKTLRELKFSNQEVKKILFLEEKLRQFASFAANPTAHEARKFLSAVKNDAPEGFEKSLREFIAFGDAIGLQGLDKLKEFLSEKSISRKELAISGNDLIALNIPQGAKIKKILDTLYEQVLENPELNEKQKLLELAKRYEKLASHSERIMMSKTSADKDWWRLSDPEEQELLNKEFDFGGGLKFKAKDVEGLAKQVEVPAGPPEHHPEKNQLLHNTLVYEQARRLSQDPMVWFAALLHDVGKTQTDKSIWPKQHGHEELGVPIVEQISNLLGVPEEWKDFAKAVAQHHLVCHRAKEMTPRVLKKLFEAFKNDKEKFKAYVTTCEADARGRMGGLADRPYDQKEHMLREWDLGWDRSTKPSTLAISGYDLMQAFPQLPAGPKSGEKGRWLGEVLSKLKEMVAEHPEMNDRETLLDIAKQLIAQRA